MYILNIAMKKMSDKELKDFIFENYRQQVGFPKENYYYSMKHLKKKDLQLFAAKLTEKIPDPRSP